jgi:hypothetical protein
MRTVLIDASSAILLYKGGLFAAMARAFRLTAVDPVSGELTREGYPGAETFAAALADGRLVRLPSDAQTPEKRLLQPCHRLHAGERATLAAMLDQRGEFVIIDDGPGAQFCRDHSLPHINALLCPRILRLAGRLPAAAAMDSMGRIRREGRYAPAILDFAENCEDDRLGFFLPWSGTK